MQAKAAKHVEADSDSSMLPLDERMPTPTEQMLKILGQVKHGLRFFLDGFSTSAPSSLHQEGAPYAAHDLSKHKLSTSHG